MTEKAENGRHANAAMREIINLDDNALPAFSENQSTFVPTPLCRLPILPINVPTFSIGVLSRPSRLYSNKLCGRTR